MFQSEVWHWRRAFRTLGNICGTVTTEKTEEKEQFYIFFDFIEDEVAYENE